MSDENIETQDGAEQAHEEQAAPTEATRDELIEAAKQASAEGQPEEGAETPATPPAEEEPNWMRLMKAREKAQAEREAARNYAEDAKKRAEAEAAAIIEEAKKRAAAEIEQERTKWRTRFETDPNGALRELGDAESVASKVLELNTPHGKAIAELKSELAEAKSGKDEAKKVREEFEAFKRSQEESAARARYEAAKSEFLTKHATSETTPYLMARYDTDELVERANKVARDWNEAGLQFDLADVASYLEDEAKKRLSSLGLQPAKQVPAGPQGNAPKVAANGQRTITAAAGSERRAAPRPFHELSAAEQREDLIKEVQRVWRASGHKT